MKDFSHLIEPDYRPLFFIYRYWGEGRGYILLYEHRVSFCSRHKMMFTGFLHSKVITSKFTNIKLPPPPPHFTLEVHLTVNGVEALHLTEQIFPVTINCIRNKQSKPKVCCNSFRQQKQKELKPHMINFSLEFINI